ncbi:hypothetical protein JHK85_052944 [Glycine max]|nr:hypothetical protein JHK85_052944 [Glycine max]
MLREVEDFARRLNSDWPERMQILSLGQDRRLLDSDPSQKFCGLEQSVHNGGMKLQEVDNLQKQILALQTMKEFYWETDEQIKQLQDRVSILQDDFGEGVAIEDDEGHRLMAEAALKSF